MDVVTVALSPKVSLDLVKVPSGSVRLGTPPEEFGHGTKAEPLATATISYPLGIRKDPHETPQSLFLGCIRSVWTVDFRSTRCQQKYRR